MKIDKLYVINVNKSNDDVVKRIDDLKFTERCGWEIVEGINGKNLKDKRINFEWDVYTDWKIKSSTNEWYKRDMTIGEIGCALSHIRIWQMIAAGEEERVLVLEEDFKNISGKSINEIDLSKVDQDWDLIYLGRNAFKLDKEEKVNEDLNKALFSYNAHSYVITKSAAKKMLSYKSLLSNLIPTDEMLPAMYDKHPRKDIDKLFKEKKLKAYGVNKDWISQTSNKQTSTTSNESLLPDPKPYYEILDDSDWEEWKSKYINLTILKGEYDLMVDDLGDNIYEFPLFTEKFCREAVSLAEAENKWTEARHEFYPTNDVLCQDLGLQQIYERVVKEVVCPLCIHTWTLEGKGWPNMSSENFIARYTTVKQSHLSLHHDSSDITMVVKLNDEFDGGGTWFPRSKILANPERVGTASIHPGQVSHIHGARPIYSGRRYVLISFMKKGT